MKKIMALVAALTFTVFGAVFAQNFGGTTTGGVEAADSYADRTTQVITVEDQYADLHPTANTVTLTMEYTPLTGEVHFYYECLQASYDQGEAMNTAMGVFQDFAAEHGYKHYYYKAKDKSKYFKDKETKQRMARYSSYVYFTK
ncbi:MAG: hypothetical protein ILP18_00980 [Treponema sp.]|nr:hypothetical protein [Treponema sp.]